MSIVELSKTDFLKIIKPLYVAFGKSITGDAKDQLAVYYSFLKHLGKDTLVGCVKKLITTESYFPPIAKFFDCAKKEIPVPSQAQTRRILSAWAGHSFERDVKLLKHPILQLMAEELGLLDRYSISQTDFDNGIKYRYNRIVDEYRTAIIENRQLCLPKSPGRDLYPYVGGGSSSTTNDFQKLQPSDFNKNKFELKGKDRRLL